MSIKYSDIRDVIRVTDPLSVDKTVQNIINGQKPPPHFSYAPLKKAIPAGFNGISRDQFLSACKKGNKLSATCNTDAGKILHQLLEADYFNDIQCYEYNRSVNFPYRKDHSLLIKPPLFFVKSGRVHVPWIQLNKTDRYSLYHFSLISTILKKRLDEEFDQDVEIVILDLSAPRKNAERKGRIMFSSELDLLDSTQISNFFEVYLEAYGIVEDMGVDIKQPSHKQPYKDSAQSDLF